MSDPTTPCPEERKDLADVDDPESGISAREAAERVFNLKTGDEDLAAEVLKDPWTAAKSLTEKFCAVGSAACGTNEYITLLNWHARRQQGDVRLAEAVRNQVADWAVTESLALPIPRERLASALAAYDAVHGKAGE